MITVGVQTWRTDLLLSVRHRPNAALEADLQRLLTAEVSRLERLVSRFRSDSELTAVNAAAGRWVEVSWGFVTVLTAALDAAQSTAGLVDPTMGRAIKAAGYDEWAGQRTPTNPASTAAKWRQVGIRPGRRQAQVQIPAGTELDLGSVAKGWLADRIARTVHRSGHEVCANMGGDIRVIAAQPWTVWSDPGIPGDTGAPWTWWTPRWPPVASVAAHGPAGITSSIRAPAIRRRLRGGASRPLRPLRPTRTLPRPQV